MSSPPRNLGTLPPPPRVAKSSSRSTTPTRNATPSMAPSFNFASPPTSGNFSLSGLTSSMGVSSAGVSSLLSFSGSPTKTGSGSNMTPPPTGGGLPPPPKVTTTLPISATATPTKVSSAPPPPPPPPPPPARPVPAANSPSSAGNPTPPKANVWASSTNQNPILARRQTHLPVLLVASEKAHKLAWKNELRLTDMLQGLYNNMLASYQSGHSPPPHIPPFRSMGRFMHLSWDDLDVRFMDDFALMTDAEASQFLSDQALIHERDGNLESELCLLEDQIDNLLLDEQTDEDHTVSHEERQRQLDQVHKDAFDLTSPLSIPWLQRYRQGLDDSTDFCSHELFHCPAVCLVICTSQEDTHPIEMLKALSTSKFYLPHHLQNGWMDPNVVQRHILVLHDNIDGAHNFNDSALASELHKEFGQATAVLRINSLSIETARQLASEETSDLWGGGGRLGNCLSVNDRASLRQYLGSFVVGGLLPALESRIANLNAVVSERKKGVRNVLKSFWRTGKTKEADVDGGSKVKGEASIMYKYDTVENQTRLLGDILFILGDYDAAYSNYKLIKDDFKQDKAHAHYAAVQEMMALCLYHIDSYGRAREIFALIENALWTYSRAAEDERGSTGGGGRVTAAPPSTRLATRLCLVLIATRNILGGRNLEVADLLASASSNENALGAAVLLEQGSAHYFHGELFRKYAFHMLMSGHMFRSSEQNHHAFRCFTSALYIYRDGNWDELHNHLRSALAAQLFAMGRMAIALQLYGKLVGCTEGGRVSVKTQQKYVNNLLTICNEHPKKALAGADRLAAPTHLSGARRDAVRKEKLDRIVQVVRYTKSASRVLELHNVDLPIFDDSSVSILAEEASHHRQDTVVGLGEARAGLEEVWDELILSTTAELRAADEDKANTDNEATSAAIQSIADPEIRKVIAEIDKEELSRSLQERAKRSATYKEKPPVRAQMEPYFIEFSMRNPLGIPITMQDMQIVARMTSNGIVCTNEGAVKITPLVSYNEKPKWTFHSTKEEFVISEFCRLSSGKGDAEKETWKAAEEATPFFVISKTNMTMDPESLKTVALGICPLEQGDLEVLGVRFRLFDNVWLFHQFEIKGQLLQNTRSNRANRIRAKPMLLNSRVDRGMPCLTAELLPDLHISPQGPALQGQVRPWILRIENIGTAAASNATLKANVPWIRLPETADSLGGAVSRCIGPSGTLMRFPLKDGGLGPGESVDVPIEIRTADSGRKGLYMLFRYELLHDGTSEAPPCRWLKKMFDVPVYPSVSVAASLVPSNRAPRDHVLSLEIANDRTDSPDDIKVVLDRLTMASWRYNLEAFGGQFEDNATELGWQERLASHFKVIPRESREIFEDTLCSKAIMSSSPDTSSDYAILSFLSLERAHSSFQETLAKHKAALARAEAAQNTADQQPRSISSIRRANTALSTQEAMDQGASDKAEATSVLKLCPKDDDNEKVHIILSWHGQRGTLRGFHYCPDLAVRPVSGQKGGGCPIAISAEHPAKFPNNFAAGPAQFPFTVTLTNLLAQSPVSFEFSMEEAPQVDFSGAVRFQSKLDGGGAVKVPLEALVNASGVYNLQHVRLVIEGSSSYKFPLQWLVAVVTAAE